MDLASTLAFFEGSMDPVLNNSYNSLNRLNAPESIESVEGLDQVGHQLEGLGQEEVAALSGEKQMHSVRFQQFKGRVPHQRVVLQVANQEVEMDYYEGGGSLGLPVVFVPNLNSTAAVFYRQIEFLAEKNVRSIALSIPALFDPTSVVKAMDVFVEECLRLDGQIHLVGSGFGGYLCQLYTELRPQKVSSLFLINTFCDLDFQRSIFPTTSLMPSFLLTASLMETLPKEQCAGGIEATDFIRSLIHDMSMFEVGAKVALGHYSDSPLSPVRLMERFRKDERISIVETMDETLLSNQQKSQLAKYYPEAALAYLKTGGTYPFLANPDEFNLHLLVHLRRNSST